MNSVSTDPVQSATKKHQKVHRLNSVIAKKVIAFHELIGLKHNKKSCREAADLLEIPNSTMQSWRKKRDSLEWRRGMGSFLTTPIGADFLQKNIMAVMKLMKCGPCGIRGMQEYLRNTGLDCFVASSEGALQNFWSRCETHILEFGDHEEQRLAAEMRHKKITAGLDELFKGSRPCLVAIEVVSNFILLEKFTDDRKGDTWKKELEERSEGFNIKISQVVSDLGCGIRACAKALGAEHIPELFHVQHEISKGTSAPLASQERSAENALNEAEERLKRLKAHPRRLVLEERKKQEKERSEAINARDQLRAEFEVKAKRREDVKQAIRQMGKIHHPINLQTGQLQTAECMESRFIEQFKVIQERVQDAELLESCIDHIEKAKRAFDAIVSYMKYFFVVYQAFISGFQPEEEEFFNEVIFPLSYLRMIWRRLSKKAKEECKELLRSLEVRIRDAPWTDEVKEKWLQKGREMAETFQRSSSCVEGRNGVLSLNHHRLHRMNPKSLRVLTIIHNFDVRRADGTTAAERFFEAKHENLFDSLVMRVRMPQRPQKQRHNRQERLVA